MAMAKVTTDIPGSLVLQVAQVYSMQLNQISHWQGCQSRIASQSPRCPRLCLLLKRCRRWCRRTRCPLSPTQRSKFPPGEVRNEKGQKSNLICELVSRTHDAERAARVARGCREEQDDAIDDPGDVEDDNRHDGEEQAKSQDIFFDLHIGQPSPDGKQSRADKGEDQEQKKAVKEQPD